MTLRDDPLILASASPQRRAILTQAGIPFAVAPAHVEEREDGEPRALAVINARMKALAGDHGDALVLGADTVVAVDGRPLGKPRDAEEARAFLGLLQGRAHDVIGAIALARAGAVEAEALEVTEVVFRALTAAEIDAYVALGEWRGRAGGYAIQGRGAVLVRAISGDYLNVVGLALARVVDMLPHDGLQEILSR